MCCFAIVEKYALEQALARILKLPIIFESAPIQNGLKLYKIGLIWFIICPTKMEVNCQNDGHDVS